MAPVTSELFFNIIFIVLLIGGNNSCEIYFGARVSIGTLCIYPSRYNAVVHYELEQKTLFGPFHFVFTVGGNLAISGDTWILHSPPIRVIPLILKRKRGLLSYTQ
jgi:hypothetical protein